MYARSHAQAYICNICGGVLPFGCICNRKKKVNAEDLLVAEVRNHNTTYYFVGAREAIQKDIELFGDGFKIVREMTIAEAHTEGFEYLEDGIKCCLSTWQKSYKILKT